jgi:hypothetical protein
VYWTVYSLDATRCIILHLAATQSLQHAAGYCTSCKLCALIVAGIALAVAQVTPLLPPFSSLQPMHAPALCGHDEL